MLRSLDARHEMGAEMDVSNEKAARLIERGYAVPVRAERVETAVITAPEIAAKRKPRKRKVTRNVGPTGTGFGAGD